MREGEELIAAFLERGDRYQFSPEDIARVERRRRAASGGRRRPRNRHAARARDRASPDGSRARHAADSRPFARAVRGRGARERLAADESKLADALHSELAPDFARAPEIGFVHRKLTDTRWKVTFPAGAELMEKLHAWPDPFYSGQAT
jgi:hypothetical protein